MHNFKDFTSRTITNTHSTHVEDLIFTKSKQGAYDAIDALQHITNTIGTSNISNMVSTKIDGCVDKDTLVVTLHGSKRICQLTNNDFVKVYDIKTQKFKYCNNALPRCVGRYKQWVTLTFENHSTLKCTVDHQCLTNNMVWVEAQHMLNRYIFAANVPNKRLKVIDVTHHNAKYDQYDITTSTSNFVIDLSGTHVVIHNSPAIVFGYKQGKFFVGSKSVFNANAKFNFTDHDIDQNHKGELAEKLKVCLKYLKHTLKRSDKYVYQADMLYTKSSIKQLQHDGKQLIGFHPNTILYTVDRDSDIAKQILRSKLGIVVHTKYQWVDDKLNVVQYGVESNALQSNDDVFITDAVDNLKSNKPIGFTTQQTKLINTLLQQCIKIVSYIDWNNLQSNQTFYQTIQRFINHTIRQRIKFNSANEMTKSFLQYVEQFANQQADKLKTQKAKQRTLEKYDYSNIDVDNITTLMQLFINLTSVKLQIISKLNQLSVYNNFVLTNSGDMIATGDEGFVISQTSAKGAKLVDRLQFSANNFSSDIIKGWVHNR